MDFSNYECSKNDLHVRPMEKIGYPIINNRIFLQNIIGKGSSCEVCLGRDLSEISPASARFVAVKLQNWNIDHSIVKHEANFERFGWVRHSSALY